MNKEELAKLLNGREYGNEITVAEKEKAKENNLVVVFGYSDDCMEFCGAIDDEVDCFDGGVAYLDGKELVESSIIEDCKQCRFLQKHLKHLRKIEAVWCPKDMDCSWKYETDIPHSKFNIYEDGELYCVGIVFDLVSCIDLDWSDINK